MFMNQHMNLLAQMSSVLITHHGYVAHRFSIRKSQLAG